MIPAIAIPAVVALVCKTALLGYSLKTPAGNSTTRLLRWLLAALVLQNLIEVFGLSLFHVASITPLLEKVGTAYLSVVVIVVALVLRLSLRLSFDPPNNDHRAPQQLWIYAPCVVLLILFVATDYLVVGFQPYRNSILRVPGPWYFLFETYVALYMLAALACLIYGARPGRRSAKGRSRNALWLLALLPLGLLFLYLIVANHLGTAKITSTIYLPVPMAIFLIVATYATHHNRLPDLAFFIPGSRVRQRKVDLYGRIQRMIAEQEGPQASSDLADRLTRTFSCPVEVVERASSSSPLPIQLLRKVRKIVVVDEIEAEDPELFRSMRQHKIDAIVPFQASPNESASWVLFGAPFVDEVYTPLDFVHLERLFERIQTGVLENFLPLRSQLLEATGRLSEVKRQLAASWSVLEEMRRKVEMAKAERYRLDDSTTSFVFKGLAASRLEVPEEIVSGECSIEQFLLNRESAIVSLVLRRCSGDLRETARMLGVSPKRLRYLIERHEIPRE